MSSGERKRRRLNLVRVIGGGRCAWGVVGHDRSPSAGVGMVCCWWLNLLGWGTVVRDSRVGQPVTCCVGCVPE